LIFPKKLLLFFFLSSCDPAAGLPLVLVVWPAILCGVDGDAEEAPCQPAVRAGVDPVATPVVAADPAPPAAAALLLKGETSRESLRGLDPKASFIAEPAATAAGALPLAVVIVDAG